MPLPSSAPRPAQVKPDDSGFGEFHGIVNTRTAKERGRSSLTVAENVEIDNELRLFRRDGYSSVILGNIRGGYATNDQSKMYLINDTDLVRVMEDGSQRVLKSGLSLAMAQSGFSWHEDPSNYVAYTSGIDSGIIRQGLDWVPLAITTPRINDVSIMGVGLHQSLPFHLGDSYTSNTLRVFATYLLDDGRESAPSPVREVTCPPEISGLYVDVPTNYAATNLYCCLPGGTEYLHVAQVKTQTFTVPVTDLLRTGGVPYPYTTVLEGFPTKARQLTFYNGRLYASEFEPDMNMSTVWCSLPLQYHLFDKTKDFFTVIGEVVSMLPAEKGLLVGTDNQIYGWDGERLTELAQYGMMVGSCGDVSPDGVAYFWTLRGIAKAFPYELVTDEFFSGDPGTYNHARLFFKHGYTALLASTVTGNPVFNARKERP